MRKKPLVKYIRTSIGMIKHRGRLDPAVVCDVCKNPITEAGNLLWHNSSYGEPVLDMKFTHKACYVNHVIPEEIATGAPYSGMELSKFLRSLLRNSKIPFREPKLYSTVSNPRRRRKRPKSR